MQIRLWAGRFQVGGVSILSFLFYRGHDEVLSFHFKLEAAFDARLANGALTLTGEVDGRSVSESCLHHLSHHIKDVRSSATSYLWKML